uniref:Uncharacterized protein n=1 Tax=Ditylenchus dipsaci TaxID=166011 RepID=A0A915ETC4_9BILA
MVQQKDKFPAFSITIDNNNDDYRDPDQEQDALLHSSSRGGSQIVSPVYDPQARDFTTRCLKLAQYSGPKACEVFMVCCSEDNVLNKLNGDRCQRPDSTNGCTPNFQGDGVQWSQCRAFNCTEEITTTTTTTLAPPSASSPTISRIYALLTLTTSSLLLILPLLI